MPGGVRIKVLVLVAVVAIGVGVGLAVAFAGGKSEPPFAGVSLDRPVPSVQLVDEHGKPTSLAAFHGSVVVLAPSLTYCHQVCPMTSGALMQVRYDAVRAGLGKRVTVVEVSVDPWRDSPARLRAYRRLTGVNFRLLTGSLPRLTRFWRFFGVGFYPTGHGKTFDVGHTDGVFIIDGNGHERVAIAGMPDVHGKLATRLKVFLSNVGLQELAHPEPGWTVHDVLDDLGRLVGRRIQEAPLPQ